MSDISSSLCVAILTTGQMGSSLGSLLSLSNIRVITDASKRSSRTQSLASQAGIEDVGSIQAVLRQADIVLSVLVPSEAFALAASLIDVVSVGDHANLRVKYFVDLNAIAPKTARNIAQICDCTGIQFIDGGIMGKSTQLSSSDKMRTQLLHSSLSLSFLSRWTCFKFSVSFNCSLWSWISLYSRNSLRCFPSSYKNRWRRDWSSECSQIDLCFLEQRCSRTCH